MPLPVKQPRRVSSPLRIRGLRGTLSPAEQESVTRTAVEIAGGRARVIAGAGSNSTSYAIELTKRAEAAGADAILSVVSSFSTVSLNLSTRVRFGDLIRLVRPLHLA